MYKTLRLPHKGYIICCPLLMHSFATQKQITVKLVMNYGQLKILYWLSFTHYLHSYQNFNYSCFWCETACPLKRILFNFLCEQEVRKTEASSCIPPFSLQNSKIEPLIFPSIRHGSSFPSVGGRVVGAGGGGAGGPEPPHFLFACFVVPLFLV